MALPKPNEASIEDIAMITNKIYRIVDHLIRMENRPTIPDDVADVLYRLAMCGNIVRVSQAATMLFRKYLEREIRRIGDDTKISGDLLNKPIPQMTLREIAYLVETMSDIIKILPTKIKIDDSDEIRDMLHIVADHARDNDLLRFVGTTFHLLLCEVIVRDAARQGHELDWLCQTDDNDEYDDDDEYYDDDDP